MHKASPGSSDLNIVLKKILPKPSLCYVSCCFPLMYTLSSFPHSLRPSYPQPLPFLWHSSPHAHMPWLYLVQKILVVVRAALGAKAVSPGPRGGIRAARSALIAPVRLHLCLLPVCVKAPSRGSWPALNAASGSALRATFFFLSWRRSR